jgi:hypothetical protein
MALRLAFLAVFLLAAPSEQYAAVEVNADGGVIVSTVDGRHVTPGRLPPISGDMKHIGAEQAAVSPDRQSVGWLALFENCCTSYPLPLKLVILHNGRLHVLEGSSAIWFWSFQDGGKLVAAREELPHGDQGLHYDLWNVATGKRVAEYTPDYDADGHPIARPNEPEWVKALDIREARSR